MAEKLNINQWAEEDRPREKMMLHGVSALSNAELLAILIGSGSTEDSAVELMRKVLANYHNNLNELGKASIDELCQFKGIGGAGLDPAAGRHFAVLGINSHHDFFGTELTDERFCQLGIIAGDRAEDHP